MKFVELIVGIGSQTKPKLSQNFPIFTCRKNKEGMVVALLASRTLWPTQNPILVFFNATKNRSKMQI